MLLQSGKAADLAGAFGGMGSQTAFGPRGAATVLTKATTTAAVLFMVTSIWLGIEQGRQVGAGQSVIEQTGSTEAESARAPATPGNVQTLEIPPPSQQGEAEQTPATDAGAEAGQTSEPEPPQQ